MWCGRTPTARWQCNHLQISGNLPMLQWLLTNVDMPVEPTLLDTAMCYHQFGVAEWLVEHCPDGCRKFDWRSKMYEGWRIACDLDDGVLLDFLETHPTIKDLIDLGTIATYAVQYGEVAALRQLHKMQPELFQTMMDFAWGAKRYHHDDVLEFLKEIEYPFLA